MSCLWKDARTWLQARTALWSHVRVVVRHCHGRPLGPDHVMGQRSTWGRVRIVRELHTREYLQKFGSTYRSTGVCTYRSREYLQKYGWSMASLAVRRSAWSYRNSLSRKSRASGLTRCWFSLCTNRSQRLRECLCVSERNLPCCLLRCLWKRCEVVLLELLIVSDLTRPLVYLLSPPRCPSTKWRPKSNPPPPICHTALAAVHGGSEVLSRCSQMSCSFSRPSPIQNNSLLLLLQNQPFQNTKPIANVHVKLEIMRTQRIHFVSALLNLSFLCFWSWSFP